MALADIIKRIDGDASVEAEELLAKAREQAEEMLARARAEAARTSETIRKHARVDAEGEAETVRAAARLAARDRVVAEKGELVERALEGLAEGLVALPDDDYVRLIASRVAAASRGGERLLVAEADRYRIAAQLPAAIERAAGRDIGLEYAAEPAPCEHGVVLVGERSTVDLSIAALVAERRDTLAMTAAGVLFGDGAGAEG